MSWKNSIVWQSRQSTTKRQKTACGRRSGNGKTFSQIEGLEPEY
ncbi:hypothetical protein [Methanosarcina lacustris]|nr:hypothetical protein [Methanosarcina lacustris]